MDPQPQMILKDHEIVKHLTLWAQRSGWEPDKRSFELGRMSVALVLESQARIFEEYGTMTSLSINKELVASALRDCLRSLGLDDDALDMYESVCVMIEASRTRYVPVSEHADLASASQPSGQHRTMPGLRDHDALHRARRDAGAFERVLIDEQLRSIEEGAAEIAEEYRPRE